MRDLVEALRTRAAAQGGDALLTEAADALACASSDPGVALLVDIRWACGDKGARMQDELVEFIRALAADAAKWRAQEVAGD